MATPALQMQNVNLTYYQSTPQSFTATVKDTAGAPIDIDTGFTGDFLVKLDRVRSKFPGITLSGSKAFNSDGTFVLTKSGAQAADLPAGQWEYEVMVSDDAFTTFSIAQRGTISVVQSVNTF